jgi:RNA polymerase sigma factor (sigma-70 family)
MGLVTDEEIKIEESKPENINIINIVCKKYKRVLSQDVLDTCGKRAIWRCLKEHDDSKQQFTSSLFNFVRWECLDELDKLRPPIKTVSLTQDVPHACPSINATTLHECLALLPDRDHQILIEKFWYQRTLREIATLYGLSREGVRYIIRKSLDRLKEELI